MTRWSGKVLGLVAGWLLTRHPDGALLGLLLGHAWDAGWFHGPLRRPLAPPAAPVPDDAAYGVLGVTGDASDAEIDRAYRRLIARYHPDRLVGVADDRRRQAERKAGEINVAYDRIQTLRRNARK